MPEEGGDIGLCVGVVSLSPTGMIDRVLQINNEEGSAEWERGG
jgi:hypothetical protein